MLCYAQIPASFLCGYSGDFLYTYKPASFLCGYTNDFLYTYKPASFLSKFKMIFLPEDDMFYFSNRISIRIWVCR